MKVDMFNSFHTKVWYEIKDSIELNLSKEIHKHIGFIPRLQMRIRYINAAAGANE
jgi:hypothetical protein